MLASWKHIQYIYNPQTINPLGFSGSDDLILKVYV